VDDEALSTENGSTWPRGEVRAKLFDVSITETTEVAAMPNLVFLLRFAIFDRYLDGEGTAAAEASEPQQPVSAPKPKRLAGDAGMSTAEYAVGTVAAVAFAGVLYAVVSSPKTRDIIASIIERALTIPF
jgi:hypothetical protein